MSVSATQWLSWLLALVSTSLLEIAAGSDERTWGATGAVLVCEVALVLGCHALVRLPRFARWLEQSLLTAVLVLAIVPWGIELALRMATSTMWPLELVLLMGFRNAVLALAVFAHVPSCQRTGNALSTFLVIFASALAGDLRLQAFVVGFAVLGIWWLMGSYWETLRGRLAAESEQGLPRRWAIVIPIILLIGLTALPVAGTQVRALRGFMPSSGGTDWYSETARSGVGDGNALVAGTQNIQSFAPIDEAPFVSSHEPSLYDLFDDSYNEPVNNQQQDRAISIAPDLTSQQKEHHLAQSQQAGKEFSTLRRLGEKPQRKIGDRRSDALLHVRGRVPLHLKLQTFHQYDGVDWQPEPLWGRESPLTMIDLHGRPWLRLPIAPSEDIFGLPELHALKIIRLDSPVIPAQPQLLGVHIDQLDRLDFYGWVQPGLVRLEREKLPSLTTLHVQSRVIDRARLDHPNVIFSGRPEVYQQFPDDPESDRIRDLAREWTAGLPRGWQQIAAIEQRLRTEYVHDPAARPAADCRQTAADFLFNSRSGPDYQFATAAVCLLRSLNYSARLASGFYVSPDRYETRTRMSSVLPEDVHVWVEVYGGRDVWVTLEPTPGYDCLQPPPTTWQRVTELVAWIGGRLSEHPLVSGLAAVLLVTAAVQRRRLRAGAGTLIWRLRLADDPRQRVLQTLRLLDRRCLWAGLPRPSWTAYGRWWRQLAQQAESTQSAAALRAWEQLADWAAYSPLSTPCPVEYPADVCRDVEQFWSWTALRQLRLQQAAHAASGPQSLAIRRWGRILPRWSLFPSH